MIAAKAKWNLAETAVRNASFFSAFPQLSPLIVGLLTSRGLDDEEKISRFLYPTVQQLHDPLLLADMSVAVARIRMALELQEKIRIYGDYDADGVTSAALLTGTFKLLKAEFDSYIPSRSLEGYGLNKAALDDAAQQGVRLLITVDTGISAVEEVAYAKQLGIDVIVTDHHEPPSILPDAVALINPKRTDCQYPFKGLAGVGVALKLASVLLGKVPDWALQLAAIGTVADMMPLVEENRVMVACGLAAMNRKPLPAVEAFLRMLGEDKRMTAGRIGFYLAPRINASGRLDHARISLSYMTSGNVDRAFDILQELTAINEERQALVNEYVEQATQKMKSGQYDDDLVLVLADERWNPGVIGIVASRMVEMFHRPTIICSIDTEIGVLKGSARSFGGFDMIASLRELDALFLKYGGHKSAAGMTLDLAHLSALRSGMNDAAERYLSGGTFSLRLDVDTACVLDDVHLGTVEQMQLLEPFGIGNPQPLFYTGPLQIERVVRFGKQKEHLKLLCRELNRHAIHELCWFRPGEIDAEPLPGQWLEAIVKLEVNEWNRRRDRQVLIRDVRIYVPEQSMLK